MDRLLFAAVLFLSLPAPRAEAEAVSTAQSADSPLGANAAMQAALARIGWKANENGGLLRAAGAETGFIPLDYLLQGGLYWQDGRLSFVGGDPVAENQLPLILEGLEIFVKAAQTPPIEAGKALAAWGLPPVIDGRKLVDPDGSATYYGQMLNLLYSEKPEALRRASAERLSQALDLICEAHWQAFKKQAADVAQTDVERAKLMLFASPRAGETPLQLAPYQDLGAQLDGFKKQIEADRRASAVLNGGAFQEDSEAISVLGTLVHQRYHANLDLPPAPKPGAVAAVPAMTNADESADVPLSAGLPRLLKTLDRINGKPLTAGQQENLIKSFPMGDIVWRMGVSDLWRQGLTGKGVKVAVIDGGIARHDELEGAVKSRTNFTADRGESLPEDHGTHVAGIFHALAPDAEIRGYTVHANEKGDESLAERGENSTLNAIDQAVKDGNRIINISLVGGNSPTDAVARKVEEYARKGVIFVAAAGNAHDQGIQSPAVAPDAITVGALDGAGRPIDPSSYGSDYDPRRLTHVVKTVFMASGSNVYSTVGRSDYDSMSGTSMATPAVSGVVALLTQAAAGLAQGTASDPAALSVRVRAALAAGAAPMSLDKLPSNVPFDQTFLVVRPQASLDALRQQAAPSTAGGPGPSSNSN